MAKIMKHCRLHPQSTKVHVRGCSFILKQLCSFYTSEETDGFIFPMSVRKLYPLQRSSTCHLNLNVHRTTKQDLLFVLLDYIHTHDIMKHFTVCASIQDISSVARIFRKWKGSVLLSTHFFCLLIIL